MPTEKIGLLLDETSKRWVGWDPALQTAGRHQAIVGDFKTDHYDVNDIENSGPIFDSQVNTVIRSERWAQIECNLAAHRDQGQERAEHPVLGGLNVDEVNAVFSGVRDSPPQTLANLEVVLDMLKRYHAGVEQLLAPLPQAADAQTVPRQLRRPAAHRAGINYPPPCLTGLLPASEASWPMVPACRREPIADSQDAQLRGRATFCVDVLANERRRRRSAAVRTRSRSAGYQSRGLVTEPGSPARHPERAAISR